ncbi:rhodanese-like domain-containing protein [Marivirga tractuosa]|uniref:rhodanese-like domain-containing protein n=1 Tax=Marivirga tractuosa TaxID=1006 RepID=UPI0035CF97D6
MPANIKQTKDCMEPEELKEALNKNEVIQIIDVKNKDEYENAHIPEAINIPLDELSEKISKLDKSTYYVTVCGKGGGRSVEAAKTLKEAGLSAIWLCGGTNKWLDLY